MVGAAVIVDHEIVGFAVSCRALGMGIEHTFLRHILDEMKDSSVPPARANNPNTAQHPRT
ncbi:hypothetical protein [Bradyrhizobium canariense]|uniref:hypothetical protein n=1 Tax=Bradyrhizobium canariense TaxID=255045 RepID=UPI0011BA833B|nr:hypothetical protein [Bradyrhizobium canariense]